MAIFPSRTLRAPRGQLWRQQPHLTHTAALWASCGTARWDSGLAHQAQRRGQPWKNTVVRTPGPSSVEKCWMLKICAVSSDMAQIPSLVREMISLRRLFGRSTKNAL